MIKIICVGKIKEKYYIDALEEYLKRLSKYTKIKIIELPIETIYIDNNSNSHFKTIKDSFKIYKRLIFFMINKKI